MKATKIFMMAALALTFAACSNNDDIDLAQQPTEQPANGEITITATLDANDGASTRALSIDGSNIASTWETTDEFAILYNNGTEDTKSIATVDKIDGTTVTITFTIPASLANNTACTIVYPASAAKADNSGADVATALATQDGTIENCPEVRVGTATIDKDNHNLSSVTQLTAQNAIFKFTLSGPTIDASHPLVIKRGENDVVTTVTPASSTTSVYVAMPSAASSNYRFIVKTDNNKCIKSGTATITAGKYYQTTLDMPARYPLALSSATVDDLGSVIGADGKIYLNMTAATGASPATTAVAMIAYKSETVGESLAIQLNASPESMLWSDACSYSSYPSITGNPGTWRLPSKADWQNMFVGCAKSGDAGASDSMDPIAGFKEKIGATGITWNSANYWSSTASGSQAWRVYVNLNGSYYALANFFEAPQSTSRNVLGCLAF